MVEQLPEGFIRGYDFTVTSLVFSENKKSHKMLKVGLGGGDPEMLLHDLGEGSVDAVD